ncbi:unnamed protein product, partial [Mesorhabditis belari]|uniref:Uncharacterized protein n=1 Tax=Mesorhabditis belari TaxID=2138241 RepID=A0AAF3F5L5_9BILA
MADNKDSKPPPSPPSKDLPSDNDAKAKVDIVFEKVTSSEKQSKDVNVGDSEKANKEKPDQLEKSTKEADSEKADEKKPDQFVEKSTKESSSTDSENPNKKSSKSRGDSKLAYQDRVLKVSPESDRMTKDDDYEMGPPTGAEKKGIMGRSKKIGAKKLLCYLAVCVILFLLIVGFITGIMLLMRKTDSGTVTTEAFIGTDGIESTATTLPIRLPHDATTSTGVMPTTQTLPNSTATTHSPPTSAPPDILSIRHMRYRLPKSVVPELWR